MRYLLLLLLIVGQSGIALANRCRYGSLASPQFQDIITRAPWVDVRAFGAVGDGVTDDTAACQAALDFAITNGNTETYFPTGTYMVTGLTIATKQRIHGDGTSSTIKLIASSDTNVIDTSGSGINSTITIKDIQIDGNRANNASGNGIHLDGTNILWLKLERVFVTECQDIGIYIDNCNVASIQDCRIGECDKGLYILDSEQINAIGTTIEVNDTYGVTFDQCTPGASRLVDCWFESGGTVTPTDYIIIQATDAIIVDSCRFAMGNGTTNGPTNAGINVLTGGTDCYFATNSFTGTLDDNATAMIVFDSGSSGNMSINNRGGSGGTVGGGTLDEDGRNYIFEVNTTSSTGLNQAGRNVLTRATFTGTDTTPSVKSGNVFLTSGTTTITDFDDGADGQIITIISRATITFDTTTGQDADHNLDGSSADITTEVNDITTWFNLSNTWHLISNLDASVDNN